MQCSIYWLYENAYRSTYFYISNLSYISHIFLTTTTTTTITSIITLILAFIFTYVLYFCRWAQFNQIFDEIDAKVTALVNKETVKYRRHIGAGHYVSVTTGFNCVDFRRFYIPYRQSEAKPMRTGIALHLREWSEMRKLIDTVNNDFPALATGLDWYLQLDENQRADIKRLPPLTVV